MNIDLQQPSSSSAHDPFDLLGDSLANFDDCPSSLDRAVQILTDISEAAQVAAHHEAAECARLLVQLLGLVEHASDGCAAGSLDVTRVLAFVRQSAEALRAGLNNEAGDTLREIAEEAQECWGDWLALLPGSEEASESPSGALPWQESSQADGTEDREDAEVSAEEVGHLLNAIQANGVLGQALSANQGSAGGSTPDTQPVRPCLDGSTPAFTCPPPPSQLDVDGELLEPYLEDASRCLASIEAAALAHEQAPHDAQALRTICRDLHTLKGASATVGLSELAAYLHDLEETLEGCCDGTQPRLDPQSLFVAVDGMRRHVSQLSLNLPLSQAADALPAAVGGTQFEEASPRHEETLRVRASQLDRLMDMLAELVMFRNRRDSRVSELRRLNDDLIQCATRLRVRGEAVSGSNRVHPFNEVATDVLEIARGKRSVCDHIAEEDLAVSRIIRDFRQELMQLRRLPVSGLFRRLQRAVRDAARSTGRQVRFEMRGEHSGLERSLQERLYEPLLHIVRNAVSHGIEPAELRQASGKDPVGTVTMEARGGTNLLVLEVRDDGQGLDYDALRRRAVQRGLLDADQPAGREELARLIFHPGFSTRDQADGVSGRGVGMDVVAETLNRMRSWVEVDSTPGEGTQIRLSIPLRSVIEHTMVFRASGQLFAVPMQFVQNAGRAQLTEGTRFNQKVHVPTLQFADLMGGKHASQTESPQRLLLGYSRPESTPAEPSRPSAPQPRRFELLVDKIVGPEEVVVRPLPPLLRQHELFSGVTLSGAGELVLLFDSRCLIELALTQAKLPRPSEAASTPPDSADKDNSPPRRQVLVVDDSISSRRWLVRALQRRGLETVEAADGQAALEWLRKSEFAAIFSDLEMPRLGGLELLQEIAQLVPRRRPPLVMVSSRSEEALQTSARQQGAVQFLPKPLTEKLVTQSLRELGLVQEQSARES